MMVTRGIANLGRGALRLRSVAVCLSALFASVTALALDNTVSNDFWCTWNYVNPSPNTAVSAAGSIFDTFISNEMESNVIQRFSSEKPSGFIFVIR